MDFCAGSLSLFDAHFMGDKFPIFDFIVNVIDSGNVSSYFFAQVKTSNGIYEIRKDGKRYLSARLGKEELNAMVAYPGPAYLVGIDDRSEKAYIIAVDKPVSRGFSAMSTAHEINCVTLNQLRDEVNLYWQNGPAAFSSRFSY